MLVSLNVLEAVTESNVYVRMINPALLARVYIPRRDLNPEKN